MLATPPALHPTASAASTAGACVCGQRAAQVRRQVDRFEIVRCTACSLERLTPQPTEAELAALYQEAYFESADPASPGYAAYGAMEEALLAAAEAQLATLPALSEASSAAARLLLDVGCGYGTFVALARQAGWDARGMDYSAAAANAARGRYGVDIEVGDFASHGSLGGPYDVITMWDAIEHFPDPLQALRAAFDALKPGGRLIISTPDVKSWDARVLGRGWYGYTKVPEHLWYFSRETLGDLGQQAGFEVLSARAWGFVRSFGFCTDKLGTYHPAIGRLSRGVTDLFRVTDKRLFFNILDMLVVLERPQRSAA